MNNKLEKRKQKYTCHTCHWPIYEGEEVWKSTTGRTTRSSSSTTYHGGGWRGQRRGVYGGVSRRYGSGESDRKSFSWIQCGWCLAEFEKEKQRYYNWVKNFLSKGWKWYFYVGGMIIGAGLGALLWLVSKEKEGYNIWLIIGMGALLGLIVGGFLWEKFWNWYHDKYSPDFDRYRERERERENENLNFKIFFYYVSHF